MLIYVIRHGETRLNATGTLQGWMDVPLNENGIKLARITGENMRPIRFDRCISSPLVRALDTAKIVLESSGNADVPIETDERIKEIASQIDRCRGDRSHDDCAEYSSFH